MRLLRADDDGHGFVVTKDILEAEKVPEYAILSHTWGSDDEEVTFVDVRDGTGLSKAGYAKIRFCAEQAKIDCLKHFWVDSCCIDRSNNNELSTAINSMFRWYRKAAKCYVYLADVTVQPQPGILNILEQRDWVAQLRNSRWFCRGWTLQELIAPRVVEFYSSDSFLLGNRSSLEQTLVEITGISNDALRGYTLTTYTVEERISWSASRLTTIPEDKAYALLGILGIYLPLIYGEGYTNAMRRIRREINDSGDILGSSIEPSESSLYAELPVERLTIETPGKVINSRDGSVLEQLQMRARIAVAMRAKEEEVIAHRAVRHAKLEAELILELMTITRMEYTERRWEIVSPRFETMKASRLAEHIEATKDTKEFNLISRLVDLIRTSPRNSKQLVQEFHDFNLSSWKDALKRAEDLGRARARSEIVRHAQRQAPYHMGTHLTPGA